MFFPESLLPRARDVPATLQGVLLHQASGRAGKERGLCTLTSGLNDGPPRIMLSGRAPGGSEPAYPFSRRRSRATKDDDFVAVGRGRHLAAKGRHLSLSLRVQSAPHQTSRGETHPRDLEIDSGEKMEERVQTQEPRRPSQSAR